MTDLVLRLHGLKRIYKLAKTKNVLAKIEELEMAIHKLRAQNENE